MFDLGSKLFKPICVLSRRPFLNTTLLIVLCALIGCASPREGQTTERAKVYHCVFCWLKEPGNSEQRKLLIEQSRAFAKIPGVLSVEAGEMLESDRPIVDSSYDVGIVMTFASEEAMHQYLPHPQHKKAVQEILAPLTQKIVVYDFTID